VPCRAAASTRPHDARLPAAEADTPALDQGRRVRSDESPPPISTILEETCVKITASCLPASPMPAHRSEAGDERRRPQVAREGEGTLRMERSTVPLGARSPRRALSAEIAGGEDEASLPTRPIRDCLRPRQLSRNSTNKRHCGFRPRPVPRGSRGNSGLHPSRPIGFAAAPNKRRRTATKNRPRRKRDCASTADTGRKRREGERFMSRPFCVFFPLPRAPCAEEGGGCFRAKALIFPVRTKLVPLTSSASRASGGSLRSPAATWAATGPCTNSPHAAWRNRPGFIARSVATGIYWRLKKRRPGMLRLLLAHEPRPIISKCAVLASQLANHRQRVDSTSTPPCTCRRLRLDELGLGKASSIHHTGRDRWVTMIFSLGRPIARFWRE